MISTSAHVANMIANARAEAYRDGYQRGFNEGEKWAYGTVRDFAGIAVLFVILAVALYLSIWGSK